MYKITYKCLTDGETKEINHNTNDREKIINIYNRLISANPNNYKIIDIINLEDQEIDNQYLINKDNELKKVLKNIKNKVNLITKNKYKHTYGNELKSYKIDLKSDQVEFIIDYIKNNYNKINNNIYYVNDDIEINIAYNTIFINALNAYN